MIRGKPGPQKGRRGSRGPRSETSVKAHQLHKDSGIPMNLAYQVAMGNLDLNEVLQRLARSDKVEAMMRKHDLPKALATQIALGQADLEQALFKRRYTQHLSDNRNRSLLAQSASDAAPIFLALHGLRRVEGTVLAVGPYEFEFQADGAPAESVHKLQAKFGAPAEMAKKIRNQVRKRKDGLGVVEPKARPQDRYGCSDKRLYGYLEAETKITVHLLEGEILSGKVEWVGRWEFGLAMNKGVVVTVFRHAVCDIEAD